MYFYDEILGQPLVLTAEEFANLTQQTAGKSTTEAGSTTKLVQSIGRIQSPSNNYSKPILNTSCASPPSVVFDNDVITYCHRQTC